MKNQVDKSNAEYAHFGDMLSLDTEPFPDDTEGDVDYYKIIENVHLKNPEQVYIEKWELEELYKAMSLIEPRQMVYLRYRYGFEDDRPHSLKETADSSGLHHFHLTQLKIASFPLKNILLHIIRLHTFFQLEIKRLY